MPTRFQTLRIALLIVFNVVTFADRLHAQENGLPPNVNAEELSNGTLRGMYDLFGWPLSLMTERTPEPASTFTVIPDLAETQAPYSHWKTHTGTAPECIASLRLRQPGRTSDEFVSALVVRCDGFILVPRTAYEKLLAGAAGDIVVTGAEAETVTAPFPLAGWERFASGNHRVDYALVKVNGHHIRCLPLLAGSNVHGGVRVRITYSVPKVTGSSSICTATTLHATVGDTQDHGIHFALQSLTTQSGESVAADSVPPGAAVVDEETGAGLGMVTGPGPALTFSTFLRFGDEFNEVGLAPSRKALMLAKQEQPSFVPDASQEAPSAAKVGTSHLRTDYTVNVPGGPVTLSGPIREYYIKNYKTDVVCMPGFQVDGTPTTNGEFRSWLLQSNGANPRPAGWDAGELQNPVRSDDLPVTGVPAKEAMGYLNTRDMRLMTEVEWQRASRVTDLHWLQSLWRTWEDLDIDFRTWAARTAWYWWGLAQNLYEHLGIVDGEHLRASTGITSMSPEELLSALHTSAKYLSTSIDVRLSKGFFPRYIHPVGAYQADVSVYGVRDVTLNAPEMTLPRGFRETEGYKPFADLIDPFRSTLKYTYARDTAALAQSIDQSPAVENYYLSEIAQQNYPPYYLQVDFWRSPSNSLVMPRIHFNKEATPLSNKQRAPSATFYRPIADLVWSLEWNAFTDSEFRGAR